MWRDKSSVNALIRFIFWQIFSNIFNQILKKVLFQTLTNFSQNLNVPGDRLELLPNVVQILFSDCTYQVYNTWMHLNCESVEKGRHNYPSRINEYLDSKQLSLICQTAWWYKSKMDRFVNTRGKHLYNYWQNLCYWKKTKGMKFKWKIDSSYWYWQNLQTIDQSQHSQTGSGLFKTTVTTDTKVSESIWRLPVVNVDVSLNKHPLVSKNRNLFCVILFLFKSISVFSKV